MSYDLLIHILKTQPKQGQTSNSPDPNRDYDPGKAKKEIDDITVSTDTLEEVLRRLRQAVFATGTRLKAFKQISTEAFEPFQALINGSSDLVRGVTQVDVIFSKLSKRFIDANKTAFQYENRYKSLTTQFKLGQVAAADFSVKLDGFAKNAKLGSETIYELAGALEGMGGILLQSSKGLDTVLQSQFMYQKQLGVSAEAATGMQLYITSLGKTDEQFMRIGESLKEITGLQNVHAILAEEIGRLSADTQFQYGRIPGNLETAVLKAKTLGLTMDNLAATGNSLLNIEQSIGSELEYQLLSGRRLVDNQGNSLTNAYRMATIQGDANKQADIMNKILENEGDVIKTNMFARQKLAETLGMDEKTLSKALQQREISAKYDIANFSNLIGKSEKEIAAITGQTGKNLQEIVAAADIRTGEERLIESLNNLGNVLRLQTEGGKSRADSVTTLTKETLAAAEIFNKQDGIIDQLRGVADQLGIINKLGEPIKGYLDSLKDFGNYIPGYLDDTLQTFITEIEKSLTDFLGSGAVSGTEKVTNNSGNDIFIPAGGSSTSIVTGGFGEFTKYNLNPGDDVLAAPGIRNAVSQGSSIDTSALASVIANAIQHGIERAKIVATIRTDDIFSNNMLNNSRY
jgi:hypothetical protein